MNRYGRLLNPPSTTLNIQQNDLRKRKRKRKEKRIETLVASIFLPSSHWVDREEMEWQQGRGSEKSGSEGERERKSMWSENKETDRKSRKRELRERERGGGDWLNYDQGTMNTHLARCFISSPRTCRFLSGSLWTRQWTAWMRDSGLPPSVQMQKQPCTHIKLQGILCAPRMARSQHSSDGTLYSRKFK